MPQANDRRSRVRSAIEHPAADPAGSGGRMNMTSTGGCCPGTVPSRDGTQEREYRSRKGQ